MKTKYNTKGSIYIVRISALFAIILTLSCQEFVQVDPPKSALVGETIFQSDATATAVISAIYDEMSGSFLGAGSASLLVLNGFSSDELMPPGFGTEALREFHINSLTPVNSYVSSIWSTGYSIIYQSNAILEGLSSSTGVSEATKEQLEGEAFFIRAYTHFHLANHFGGVPYVMVTDYRSNSNVSRQSTIEVFNNVVRDLEQAKARLADDYSFSKGERVRVNKWAAAAFLARVHLYAEDWANAEVEATAIIDNSSLYEIVPMLEDVFLKGSREAIWQWMPPSSGANSSEGSYFILTGSPNIASLQESFPNQFEPGDLRADRWVGSFTNGTSRWYFPFKYKLKVPTASSQEYSMVMRLAETYLIRSEARARQGNLPGAIADLDVIRERAGLLPIADVNPTISQDEMLMAIEQERRSELFCENHRWYDLNRTDRADVVLGTLKPDWDPTDRLYPLPESELLINPLLKPQNAGY